MAKYSPFFSVIIITYNREALLPRAIESVQSQTFDEWEVIVVDDGSEDDTEGVVKKYQDPRIRYHKLLTNQGKAKARNYGVNKASGRYITYLDSDDELYSCTLATYYQFLEKKEFPVCLVYGGIKWADESRGKEVLNFHNFENHPEWNLVEFNLIYLLATIVVCIHRDVFKAFEFDPKFKVHGDNHFFARVATKFPFYFIHEILAVAYIHEENTRQNQKKFLENSEKSYNYFLKDPLLKHYLGKSFHKTVREKFLRTKINLAKKENQYGRVRKETLKFLFNSPPSELRSWLVKNYFASFYLQIKYWAGFG